MSETPLIGAGSLKVSGTFDMTLSDDGAQAFAALLYRPWPPRCECRLAYAEGDEHWCPVCHERAEAVVLEGLALVSSGSSEAPGKVTYRMAGMAPVAYRCEPCGHRFDRDGKEIEHEA